MDNNLKIKIVRIFQKLAEIEMNKGRFFPSRAFKISANQVLNAENYDTVDGRVRLSDSNDQVVIMGASSSEIFLDIVTNGFSSRYESECIYLKPSSDLTNISGIGEVKSEKLIKAGITSIMELAKLNLNVGDTIPNTDITFNSNMDVGLKFYLRTKGQRIPRTLAHEYLVDFKKYLLDNGIKNFEMYPVGSYRRMKDTVGDIDIILTSTKDNEISLNVLEVVSKWFDDIFVSGDTKVAGVKGVTQVDVRLIDRKYLGAHILHGTGSQEFNIKIRSHAKLLGLRLNEYGIIKDNKLITFDSEKEIFNYLGIPYVNPQER